MILKIGVSGDTTLDKDDGKWAIVVVDKMPRVPHLEADDPSSAS